MCVFTLAGFFSRVSLILSSVLVVCVLVLEDGAVGCDVTSYVTDTPPLWFEVRQGSFRMH